MAGLYRICVIDGLDGSTKNRRVLARVFSAALIGVEAVLVRVEVDVSHGLPLFTTVGLPDSAVRESRERVRTAIRNAGFAFPNDRVTVNLAPADIRKEGASFDLPIALGILSATGALADRQEPLVVVGELALDGQIQPVRGVLAVGLACRRHRIATLLVPQANFWEAVAVGGLRPLAAATLRDAVGLLRGEVMTPPPAVPAASSSAAGDDLDLDEVRGQAHAKRAIEIAAAGAHNVLLVGPPGGGKTMLARRLAGILPAMTDDEIIEVSAIWSVAGLLPPNGGLLRSRPFRAPHHTISVPGLIGGGSPPHSGEVTLAHRGVLFMDELPEFAQHVLESLRQPLEDGRVAIARATGIGEFPASFQLVAAANPCRRGCPTLDSCLCTPAERARYLGRLSRPLLDRIDLHVELPALTQLELAGPAGDNTITVRRRVEQARVAQRQRFRTGNARVNAQMTVRQVRRHCPPPPDAARLLAAAMTQLGLSARGHDRVLKVARTIADLEGSEALRAEHCAEALQYRGLDRQWRV